MKPPGLGIAITRPDIVADDGTLTPQPYQDVILSGNRTGLLELAAIIQKVALSDQDGYHVHLYPDDDSPLVRTAECSLTITKNSLK